MSATYRCHEVESGPLGDGVRRVAAARPVEADEKLVGEDFGGPSEWCGEAEDEASASDQSSHSTVKSAACSMPPAAAAAAPFPARLSITSPGESIIRARRLRAIKVDDARPNERIFKFFAGYFGPGGA
ncbi:unnamed protein product, partial [Nesidiocoris tenuis]